MKDLNVVILTGRLTADPEVRYLNNQNNTALASFTLAVNRSFVKKDDSNAPTADFIRCQCFGNSAKFAEQYMKKGTKAQVRGHIQTGSYVNKEGVKVFTTDVIVEDIGFGESKNNNSSNGSSSAPTNNNNSGGGFSGGYQNGNGYSMQGQINIPEGTDAVLPFS